MSEEYHGLPGEMYPMPIDQQDECPKEFYCLPESCGDCPHDQQDEQAMTYCDTCNQQTVESVSSRRYSHEDLHDAEQRAFMAGIAEGERAERERIIGILKTVQAIDYNTPIGEQPYMIISGIIDEIREGRA